MFLKTLTALLGLLLFTTPPTYAANFYQVGGVMEGEAYNDALKTWVEREFRLKVVLDERKKEHLFFVADTGLGDAYVRVLYSKALRQKLESAILKAIKWSEIARKHKADTLKPIGCFGIQTDPCKEYGEAHRQGQLGLKFFAANEGEQTDLVISIIDRDNQFIKTRLHLDPPRMKKLLANIRKIDHAFKKAYDTAKKHQELFN